MASNQVALILGAGPRVGTAVAKSLSSKGYAVAVTSRKGTGSKDANGFVSLKADFSDPNSIPTLFRDVETHLGFPPSVVVYNAAGMTPPPDKDSVLSIAADRFTADLTINTISSYVAAQECVKAWERLPKETKKTFIYTGNVLNTVVLPVPMMVTLGVGKSASAYWIGVADATYSARGYRYELSMEYD